MTIRSFAKYEKLARLGVSRHEVYLTARTDGLGPIDCIRLLRQVFGLSVVEAKEVTVVADGLGTSLEDYQENYLLPALEKALHIMEQEAQGKLFAEIIWNSAIVGHALLVLNNTQGYGEWFPLAIPETQSFLTAIHTAQGAEI